MGIINSGHEFSSIFLVMISSNKLAGPKPRPYSSERKQQVPQLRIHPMGVNAQLQFSLLRSQEIFLSFSLSRKKMIDGTSTSGTSELKESSIPTFKDKIPLQEVSPRVEWEKLF